MRAVCGSCKWPVTICMLSPQWRNFGLTCGLIAGRLRRFIGGRLGLALMAIFMRVAIGLGELIFISALMQAGLALLMSYHFHRATTMGMPANLAVIPLTQVLMPAAAAAVGLGYFSIALAKPAVWISGLALEGIAGTVHFLGGAQGVGMKIAGASVADLRVAMPSLAMILLSIAALLLAMLTAQFRRSRLTVFASVTLLFGVAAWIAFVPSHPRSACRRDGDDDHRRRTGRFHTADHAEGRALLIDAGGLPQWMHSDFDLGEQVVSSYLWGRGIDRLDVVAITHPHADHYGGMPAVIANFRPRQLWMSIDNPVGEVAVIVARARQAGINVSVKKEGDQFDYGGAISPCSRQGATRSQARCVRTTIAWCSLPRLPGLLPCLREMLSVRRSGEWWMNTRMPCC